MSHEGATDIESLRRLVIREILYPLAGGAIRRSVAASTIIEFDPRLIWLVDAGTAILERQGRSLVTLEPEDIVGPWFGSVSPLSLSTPESGPCELVGFSWAVIEQALADDQSKLRLWCSFQAALTSEFFANFAEIKVSTVAPAPKYRHYSPGETILLEGEEGGEVFILTSGAASVQVKGSPVGEIREDEVFGALAALTRSGTRTATVIATEPSDCMVFDRDEFRDLLRNSPQLLEKLFLDFSRALHDANDSMLKANSTKWRHLF
jgi:CRP/FNR family cyclic AMP-dependent transcriptional regulator